MQRISVAEVQLLHQLAALDHAHASAHHAVRDSCTLDVRFHRINRVSFQSLPRDLP